MHMRPRNLINENLLLKMAKVTPFHIKHKPKTSKVCLGEKQLKATDTPSHTNKELDQCIELVQNELKNDAQDHRELFSRISKLLIELKAKWQPCDEHLAQGQSECTEVPSSGRWKSSSKCSSRNKVQPQDQLRIPQLPLFNEKCGAQVKKNKWIKLKLGKQNHDRIPMPQTSACPQVAQEPRFENFAQKWEQAQNQIKLQKAQIQKSKLEIQNVLETNQQLKNQKTHIQQQNKQLLSKLQLMGEQRLNYQAAIQEKMATITQKQSQASSLNQVLRGILQDREREIAAIWQLKIA